MLCYFTVWYGIVRYNVKVRYGIVWYGIALYVVVWHGIARCSKV